MKLFYKPDDGWAADFIPFFWQGEYHLFYLKDYRNREKHGEGTPWFHLGTRDMVNFTEYGEALPRGAMDEHDLYVFTGCALEADGLFHIFYTGHNHHLTEKGKPLQVVLHATSSDLVTWTKDRDFIFKSDEKLHERDDWRDPFVFRNEEAGEWWMVLAARLREGPPQRRGCTALCASRDLVKWEIREPLWAPGLYYTHECPDMFRMGEWWYLLFSTFSSEMVTHYRMSRSLTGPWLSPPNDSFDTRAFYAAKTASDGDRRFIFGWNPSRDGETDTGGWQWGGNLVVHEIVQQRDGSLAVQVPPEVDAQFERVPAMDPQPHMGTWEFDGDKVLADAWDGFAWCSLNRVPAQYRLKLDATMAQGAHSCGVLLNADENLERYYQVRLEPARGRVVFDRCPRPGDQPFMLERPVAIKAGVPVEVEIFVEDSIVEAYVNGTVALSARGYNHRGGGLAGLFVNQGKVKFSNVELALASEG